MRGTHSCLLDELGVDPQVRADQMGTQSMSIKTSTRARPWNVGYGP
jgi:hypothetical protein